MISCEGEVVRSRSSLQSKSIQCQHGHHTQQHKICTFMKFHSPHIPIQFLVMHMSITSLIIIGWWKLIQIVGSWQYIYFYIFIFIVHHRKVHIQITKYTQEKKKKLSKWHLCFWKWQTMTSMQMDFSNDHLLVIFPTLPPALFPTGVSSDPFFIIHQLFLELIICCAST